MTADVCVLNSPDVDVDSCSISNCLVCLANNRDVCATCSSGYLWNANEKACVVACPDTNCIDCNQSTGECSACGVGYGMQGALCYPCTISDCSSCSFRTDSRTGKSIEICTQCSFGELTAYGQCKEIVRVGRRTVLISSVSATVLVLLACTGIGLFFIFRRRSPRLDAASEAFSVETLQEHELSRQC
ncbi:Variant-specific surface protein [Giardia duodenalis]|uniref:Variant-specific surface protein n=1 Tax=Giardia intestinalis TaxID=5741 RepID=V6TDV5_GIAIN|nr:Variant-specific surface protein [Giardia intestinalis]